jgi:hypothetical protein
VPSAAGLAAQPTRAAWSLEGRKQPAETLAERRRAAAAREVVLLALAARAAPREVTRLERGAPALPWPEPTPAAAETLAETPEALALESGELPGVAAAVAVECPRAGRPSST